jgi:hypothetical protein
MEAAMIKRLAIITGMAAVLAAALLVSGAAEAGGGAASAPSKYRNASQVATVQAQTNRTAPRTNFPITEYSSSSATKHAAKYR